MTASTHSPTANPVDQAIAKVQGIYKNWNRDTSMAQMRADWDAAFYDSSIACEVEEVNAAGVDCRWITASVSCGSRVLIYLHGGGFKMGSVISHHDFMVRLSQAADCRVLGVNYRLVPEHRYPAALEDCLAVYRWLLAGGHEPENIVLAGDSAGGGLVASTLIALRDAGDALPAAGVMLSALTDMTVSGESYETRAEADPIHQKVLIQALAKSYLGKEGDTREPLVSPLLADLSGLPPLLLQVGDRETGLSDTTEFAEKARDAGVSVELSVWDNMIHFFQQFTDLLPESKQAIDEIAQFLSKQFLSKQFAQDQGTAA